MIPVTLSVAITTLLAFANGANDNFKGVATLFGSHTTDYRNALLWATVTTFLGSVVGLFFAQDLVVAFSGRGIISEAILQLKSFPLAVAFGAALTVILATKFGFPISTTHALIGSLLGAGYFAEHSAVNLEKVTSVFFAPLVVTPVLAIGLSVFIYPIFSIIRKKAGVEADSCVCVDTTSPVLVPTMARAQTGDTLLEQNRLAVFVGSENECVTSLSPVARGITAVTALNSLHFLSAGLVCFSRGLNDTPKIAALLLVGGALSTNVTIFIVSIAMALGGWLKAQRVAETMSNRITAMNLGQGLSGNVTTSLIVIFASKFGLPVSTTHVSCGALFGIGLVTGQARIQTITHIILAWITTLPVSALLGATSFYFLQGYIK